MRNSCLTYRLLARFVIFSYSFLSFVYSPFPPNVVIYPGLVDGHVEQLKALETSHTSKCNEASQASVTITTLLEQVAESNTTVSTLTAKLDLANEECHKLAAELNQANARYNDMNSEHERVISSLQAALQTVNSRRLAFTIHTPSVYNGTSKLHLQYNPQTILS